MSREVLSNLATTTLNGAIDNSTVSIVITSATGWPSINFRVVVETELMFCTSRSGTTLTVIRSIEGTSAASHIDGSKISAVLTKGAIDQYLLDYYGSQVGDLKPTTAGSFDEEFEGANSLPTADWSWTAAPSGSDSYTVNTNKRSCLMLEGNGNTQYILTRTNFTPAATFGIWFKVFAGPQRGADDKSLSVLVRNSGNSEGRYLQLYANALETPRARAIRRSTSIDLAWESGSAVGRDIGSGTCWLYMGFTRASDSWIAWYSNDGESWQMFGNAQSHTFTVSDLVFMLATTAAPTRCGIDWVRYRTDTTFPPLV